MADNAQQQNDSIQQTQNDNAQLSAREIDEGLERDLRAALGWDDDPQNSDSQDNTNQTETKETPESSQPEEPSEPFVEIDGEKIAYSQITEWRKGYLRQSDYTQKTQQLADERRRLEEERQRLQPFVQVEQLLNQNPQVAASIQRVLREQFGVNVPAPHPSGAQAAQYGQLPYNPPVRQPQTPAYGQTPYPQNAVSRQPMQSSPFVPGLDPILDQRLSRIEETIYDQQLDRTLQNIRLQADEERKRLGLKPLDDAQWQQVSNQLMNEAYVQRRRIEDVWLTSPIKSQWAYDAVEAARQAAAQQQQEQQNRVAGAIMSGTPRGGSVSPQHNTAPRDFSDATRQAYADLREAGVSLVSPGE